LELDPVTAHRLKGLRNYIVTSERSKFYNCLALALGDQSRWWGSLAGDDPEVRYYWPDGVPNEDTVTSWTMVLRQHGYEICENGEREQGFDKVVIYGDEEGATHIARQQPTGWWLSKLGKNMDIEHEKPEELEGEYGSVQVFMRRLIAAADD
jgi:hypothetical protein